MENLLPEKIDSPRPTNAIMLSQLKRGLERPRQLMYVGMMIAEVNSFFNVRGNMNAKQIKLTAELILDNPGFYDLTLGNIKACFRDCMMKAKLYDRLDGQIIIQWLREFKSEMAYRCEDTKEGIDRINNQDDSVGSITHATYLAMLEARANDGDEEAKRCVDDYRRRIGILSEEEKYKRKMEFIKFKHDYLKRRKNGEGII